MKLLQTIGACLLAATLLSACSDDDDDAVATAPTPAPAPVTAVPASAGASSDAYTAYVATQVAVTSDTTEPLNTDAVATAPTSETAEPITVN